MISRLLRSVRSGRRPAPSRPSLARRLPMVAAAVVVAGLATACGPSSTPAGSAAPSGAQEPAPAADRTSQDASPAVSATASVLPSASASASASAPASPPGAATGSSSGSAGKGGGAAGSGSGSGSGSGTASGTGGVKPTSATLPAPAPAKVPGPGYDSSADAQALIDAALRSAKSDGPLLGAVFAVGWTPCIGPTLAAVQALARNGASAARGALLTAAYCLGPGLPFVLAALAFRPALGALGLVKRHCAGVLRTGGGMLVTVGVLLATGVWNDLVYRMRLWSTSFTGSL
ncbi:cytochrome c biogenesis CcdA family protein [Streptomyces lavendulae]|uniref:cytochrome c biogenesis CcdA family protein n=1 Tax=Streptomyces lavendulae TaxID=1914 RepID=UPI0033E8313C